ncbi:MAG TPA: STAS domain-containing protein [Amycolatopsis sp.]|uniref:STAS domain-containing protein n=1 Tax=Amycolatopsis sp. TaxID=37632 RepID=UPI002B45B4D8|nr:STAS domain-containing protein [Amycolatopsis sp.]HKS44061.1 STAS domain-containing protein [Amycolatopsis sp.]
MPAVPIADLDGVLLVTVGEELQDRTVAELQRELTERVVDTGARGVLIDISVLDVVDSYLARALHEIAAATALLAARTVLVGMRPAVAFTLAELGLTLPGMSTALSVREGMAALR